MTVGCAVCDLEEATREDLRTENRVEPSGATTCAAAFRLDSPPSATATKASERGSDPWPLSVLLVVVPALLVGFPDIINKEMKDEKQS
jgi:hypothetical protein